MKASSINKQKNASVIHNILFDTSVFIKLKFGKNKIKVDGHRGENPRGFGSYSIFGRQLSCLTGAKLLK
jgi:hypothetical protein